LKRDNLTTDECEVGRAIKMRFRIERERKKSQRFMPHLASNFSRVLSFLIYVEVNLKELLMALQSSIVIATGGIPRSRFMFTTLDGSSVFSITTGTITADT